MHKIFGAKENASYLDREGAYIIPIKDNKIGVVKTPKGYFFQVVESTEAKVTMKLSSESVLRKQAIR